MAQVPEDTFKPQYAGNAKTYFASNFGSTGVQSSAPSEGDDETETPKPSGTRPQTPLGSVTADGVRGGSGGEGSPYGGQTTPGSPGVVGRDVDRYRRGTASLTLGNIGRAIGFGTTLSGTSPLTIAAGEAIKAATGVDTGFGLPDYQGFVGPNPAGTAAVASGQTTAAQQQARDRAARFAPSPSMATRGGFGAGSGGRGGNDDGRRAGGAGQNVGGQGMAGGGSHMNQGTGSNAPGGFRHGGTVQPTCIVVPETDGYAHGGTVGGGRQGGGDGSGGRQPYGSLPWHMRQRPMQQPRRFGSGPIDAGEGVTSLKPFKRPRMPWGYAEGGSVPAPEMPQGGPPMMDMQPNGNGVFVDSAAMPDDGVVDNKMIAVDEGEAVIQRAAAAALGPDVLAALNNPQMAPQIAAVIMDFLTRRRGGMAAAGLPESEIRVASRPATPLGTVRADLQ